MSGKIRSLGRMLEGFLQGRSEDALEGATGDSILSRSSVSKVKEVLWKDYGYCKNMDLSSLETEYLFLDAVYESLRRLEFEGFIEAQAVSEDNEFEKEKLWEGKKEKIYTRVLDKKRELETCILSSSKDIKEME